MIIDLSPEQLVIILKWVSTIRADWGDLHPEEDEVEEKLREALEAEDE